MLAILKKVDAELLGPPSKLQVNIKTQLHAAPEYLSVSNGYTGTKPVVIYCLCKFDKRHCQYSWVLNKKGGGGEGGGIISGTEAGVRKLGKTK